jgi:hypothetical protein
MSHIWNIIPVRYLLADFLKDPAFFLSKHNILPCICSARLYFLKDNT